MSLLFPLSLTLKRKCYKPVIACMNISPCLQKGKSVPFPNSNFQLQFNRITQTWSNHSYKGEKISKYVVPTIIFTTCGCSSFKKSLIIIDVGRGGPQIPFIYPQRLYVFVLLRCYNKRWQVYMKYTSYASLGNCEIALPVTLCSLVPTFFYITSH